MPPMSSAMLSRSHQLASCAESIDWTDLASLVLSDGQPYGESVRRRVARDYYRHHAN